MVSQWDDKNASERFGKVVGVGSRPPQVGHLRTGYTYVLPFLEPAG